MYTHKDFLLTCNIYVATLPRENRKSKIVTDFDSILNKLLTCSWGHFERLI